jgi:hypothetical protein
MNHFEKYFDNAESLPVQLAKKNPVAANSSFGEWTEYACQLEVREEHA